MESVTLNYVVHLTAIANYNYWRLDQVSVSVVTT